MLVHLFQPDSFSGKFRPMICLMGLLLCSQWIFSQKVDSFFEDDSKHELGADVTRLIFSALGNSANLVDPNRFPFSYKYRGRDGGAIRIGLGVNMKQNNGSDFESDAINRDISLRMGKEWRKYLDKRWVGYLGIDVMTSLATEKIFSQTGSEETELKLETRQGGGGIVMGAQFAINRRLMIGTEATLYAIYQENIRTTSFEVGTARNDRDFSNMTTLDLLAPQWLYLIMRF
ncbi:MAG: hypothetical protein AAF587_06535 [Bacteroidota bacterium]